MPLLSWKSYRALRAQGNLRSLESNIIYIDHNHRVGLFIHDGLLHRTPGPCLVRVCSEEALQLHWDPCSIRIDLGSDIACSRNLRQESGRFISIKISYQVYRIVPDIFFPLHGFLHLVALHARAGGSYFFLSRVVDVKIA
jgi:hypothetical protein